MKRRGFLKFLGVVPAAMVGAKIVEANDGHLGLIKQNLENSFPEDFVHPEVVDLAWSSTTTAIPSTFWRTKDVL